MVCNSTVIEQPIFLLMISVNAGGVLFAVLSIVCIAINTSIDQSLRSILLSFSIANLLGSGMLTYDTIILLCFRNHFLNFAVTITMTLSVTHIMMLILAEYISLTASRKQRARDYGGLLLISWIISVTCGSMNVVAIGNAAKLSFVTIFIFTLLMIFRSYMIVMKKHVKKKCLLVRYQKSFLRQSVHRHKVLKRSWKTKLLGLIICGYIICSIPWIVNEIKEAMHHGDEDEDHVESSSNTILHSTSLITYSIQFYFTSFVCIYLKYIQRRVAAVWKSRSYRYRDTVL